MATVAEIGHLLGDGDGAIGAIHGRRAAVVIAVADGVADADAPTGSQDTGDLVEHDGLVGGEDDDAVWR